MGMVVFFDFTRTQKGGFSGWVGTKRIECTSRDLFYQGVVDNATSYVNGRMIVRPSVTYDEIVGRYVEKRDPKSRTYVTFKAIDLKTRDRIEVSCKPKKLIKLFSTGFDVAPRDVTRLF